MMQMIVLFHSVGWCPTSMQALTRFKTHSLLQFQSHFRQRQVYLDAPGAEVLEVLARRPATVSSVKDGNGRSGRCGGSSRRCSRMSGGFGTKKRLLRASAFSLCRYARPPSVFKGGTFVSWRPCLQVATSQSLDDLITLSAHLCLAAHVAPCRRAEAAFLAWVPSAVRSVLTAAEHASFHHGEALGWKGLRLLHALAR